MAKNKKVKNGFESLPFPIRLALQAELKKKVKSPEEREKIMAAFGSLDMHTLLTDPEALAKVMSNPAGELKNFMVDGSEQVDGGDSEAGDGNCECGGSCNGKCKCESCTNHEKGNDWAPKDTSEERLRGIQGIYG